MRLKEVFRNYLDQLVANYSEGEAARISSMVFEHYGFSKSDIIKNPDQVLEENVATALVLKLKELVLNKPVQYVIGKAWFCSMWFKVNSHVLIPRPETEELVLLAAEFAKGKNYLLDIGTGSGCIAISLSKKLSHATVDAIDVSGEAIEIAKENAVSNEARVNFSELNFLDEGAWEPAKYDVIVSNPPYIPEMEHQLLDSNVAAYEPHLALFVPDNEPLIFYKKIAIFGLQHLNAGGKIFVETHENYAKEVAAVFSEKGYSAEIVKDLFEKERFVIAGF